MTRQEHLVALRSVRTVDEAAPILRALVAADQPADLTVIEYAIEDTRPDLE